MHKLIISPRGKNQLKKIKLLYKISIGSIIDDLKNDPFLGKPLGRELKGRYSYKVGVYRIIYRIIQKDKIIQIITAGHRAVIYN
jgi:mRNA interferase RelE/StbE